MREVSIQISRRVDCVVAREIDVKHAIWVHPAVEQGCPSGPNESKDRIEISSEPDTCVQVEAELSQILFATIPDLQGEVHI